MSPVGKGMIFPGGYLVCVEGREERSRERSVKVEFRFEGNFSEDGYEAFLASLQQNGPNRLGMTEAKSLPELP